MTASAAESSAITNGRASLSRDVLVASTLRLIRSAGVGNVTLRALAADLGVSPTALYRHVRDKDDLLRLAAEAVLAEVEIPHDDEGDWAERFSLLARRTRAELKLYPGLGTYMTDNTVLFPSPSTIRLAEASLGFLLEGGFEPASAALAQLTVRGFAALGLPPRPPQEAPGKNGGVVDGYGQSSPISDGGRGSGLGLMLPASGYPALQRVGIELERQDADDMFEFGLRCLVIGLRAVANADDPRRGEPNE